MFKKLLNKKFWVIKNFRSLQNWYKRDFRSPSPSFIKQKILENHNIYIILYGLKQELITVKLLYFYLKYQKKLFL
jgi:hypothetical protein